MRLLPILATMWLLLPAGGCAVVDNPTPVDERYETNPVTGRGYWVYVPLSCQPDHPSPVIITCHGTVPFDVANHHIREWKTIGEQTGCIIVAPELKGTDGILGDGPTHDMLADERHILTLLAALGYRYNLDRANIMITGFSGGGFPTYFVGLRNPGVFSVVVGRNCNFSRSNLQGWFPPEATGQDVLVYYGENDPGTILDQSKNCIETLRQWGFTVERETIPQAGHERHPEVAMKFFRLHMRPPKPSLPAGVGTTAPATMPAATPGGV